MKFPKTKQEITQAILDSVPPGIGPIPRGMPIGDAIFKMWLTGRGGQGLRLSDDGLLLFELAKLEYYDFELGLNPKTMHQRRVIAPEAFVQEIIKKIQCPYYLGVHKIRGKKGDPFIRVYDHKTAMMITLHGNLREYLDSQKLN
jgi:hypothetical protein|tara:strand:+ start:1385 stop:1816 length:432 start_codon:yes stop_codon:yes gene_type:complete